MSIPTHPPVSIIVTNWNGRPLLERFLPTVLAAARSYSGATEIILADDASTDDSRLWTETNHPAVRFVSTEKNLGFSSNLNNAVRHARHSLVLILNNDIEVKEDALSRLPVYFDDPDVFAVRLKMVVCESNTPLPGQAIPLRHGGVFRRGMFYFRAVPREGGHTEEPPSLSLTIGGAATMLDKEKFLDMGGYDGELFDPYYWEDIDLSYRVWKRGWTIVYEPNAECFHHHRSTIARSVPFFTLERIGARNRFLFLWKNLHDTRLLLEHVFFLPVHLAWNAVRGRFFVIAGFIHACARLPAVRAQRMVLKKNSARKDGEILALFDTFRPYIRGTESLSRYRCPRCAAPLTENAQGFACPEENVSWQKEQGIPRFFTSPVYWGEIPQEETQAVIEKMKNGTYWKDALKSTPSRAAREKYDFIAAEWRANWHWFLPGGKRTRVLDIGCGMGTLSAGLSRRFGEIVAVEPVPERVEFCRLRFAQDRINNIRLVQSDIYHLPFPEHSFDVIVMNGVLEWLGSNETKGSPGDWQKKGLEIAWRLLRPDGHLFIGIENRIGYDSFMGRIDHSGLRFTALMPRWFADLYCRLRTGKPYRTYIYTRGGYRKLLKGTGFSDVRFLYPLGSYNNPYVIFESPRLLPAFRRQFDAHTGILRAIRKGGETILSRCGLLGCLFSDFLILAQKEKQAVPPLSPALAAFSFHHPGIDTRSVRGYCLSRVHPNFFLFAPPCRSPEFLVRLTSEEQGKDKWRSAVLSFASLIKRLPEEIVRSLPQKIRIEEHDDYLAIIENVVVSRPFPSLPSLRTKHAAQVFDWLRTFSRSLEDGEAAILPEILSSWETAKRLFPFLDTAEQDKRFRECAGLFARTPGKASPQHGDFWVENLGINRENRLVVYDWDTFGGTHLPGFDAFHFIATLFLRHAGYENADAAAITEYLDKHGFLQKHLFDHFREKGVSGFAPAVYLPLYLATAINVNAHEAPKEKMHSHYARYLHGALNGTPVAAKRRTVLFIDRYHDFHGGGQIYLWQLIRNLDQTSFKPIALLPASGGLASKLEESGARVVHLAVPRFSHPFGFQRAIREIMRICRENDVSLIHCNTTSESITAAALIAARKLSLPSVWQLHIALRSPFRDYLLSKAAHRIVCVSQFASEHRFPWLKGDPRLSYLHSGVDTRRFRPDPGTRRTWREQNGIPSDALVIGTLGQLMPTKGQEHLLKAFVPLSEKWPRALLAFAGKDLSPAKDFLPYLSALAKRHGLSGRVRFFEWTPEPAQFLNGTDIAVVPSLEEHFPLAVLEAMACGKPVIASKIGAIPEAVAEGKTGMLIAPGNIGELARALDELIAHDDVRAGLGAAARERAEELFSIAPMVEKMQGIYRELLGERQ